MHEQDFVNRMIDLKSRIIARQSIHNANVLIDGIIEETKPEEEKKINVLGKVVLCYVDNKLVGEYESLTKCATALGMSRAMLKRAIDNGVTLENGFKLVLKQ
jgi:hypothetical protein